MKAPRSSRRDVTGAAANELQRQFRVIVERFDLTLAERIIVLSDRLRMQATDHEGKSLLPSALVDEVFMHGIRMRERDEKDAPE